MTSPQTKDATMGLVYVRCIAFTDSDQVCTLDASWCQSHQIISISGTPLCSKAVASTAKMRSL